MSVNYTLKNSLNGKFYITHILQLKMRKSKQSKKKNQYATKLEINIIKYSKYCKNITPNII